MNRAYYATFNAARAWLRHLGRPVEGKHGAIINDFGLTIVRPGLVGPEVGRAFNRMRESRNDADYGESSFVPHEVLTMVEQAEKLVDRAFAELSTRTATTARPRRQSARERAEETMRTALVSILVRAATARGLDVPPEVARQLHEEASPSDIEELIVEIDGSTDLREAVERKLGRPRPGA
ncbi:uncharacterized protein (UPF0332 family) [Methylobacterium sp. 1030]